MANTSKVVRVGTLVLFLILGEMLHSSILARRIPWTEDLDHMAVLFLIFWVNSILFSIWLYQFIFSPTVCEGSLLSTSSPTFVISGLFDSSHTNRYEVIPLWFWLAVPWWLVMLNTFSCPCWSFGCLLWKNVSIQVCYPFLKLRLFGFIWYCVVCDLYRFGVSIFYQIHVLSCSVMSDSLWPHGL